MASPGNQHCANCIGTLSFPTSILQLSCRNANSITNTHFAQGKRSIAVRIASPLRELTCHMGSHGVTCHPAEVAFPPLHPAEAGTRLNDPGGMHG